MEKLRILLAEDHAMVREGLKAFLNAQADMSVVGEVNDGNAAVRLGRELQPDVVVMDVSMPKMNGLEATREMQRVCPNVRVLTLTRHRDSSFVKRLLAAGVSGYLLKQSASSELTRAIRVVAAGGKYLDPSIAGNVIREYAAGAAKARAAQDALSDRESAVMQMVAWGYSNKEIGAALEISVKTVEAHKANSMKKMGFRSRIDVVRYALLQGWLADE